MYYKCPETFLIQTLTSGYFLGLPIVARDSLDRRFRISRTSFSTNFLAMNWLTEFEAFVRCRKRKSGLS